ncbi:PHD finger protein 11 isoform X2 [Xiphias gladius]|uniref:PHD finger protein 11 isoform X2 n=1 Tax=Xiphias gladius TaxID=8245 RepID=UPI001A99F122|nr:PHD finger protein 11 isoform X2 [Xiphias gladius]
MNHCRKVTCLLCHLSEETEVTGPLSTKDQVTAHQNCLLFSSGIYCRNSPQFDDLFGFSVEDVMNEVKRGSKLNCKNCKRKGATVGCEVRRCKRSYHYPCAIKEGAKTIEDPEEGNYGLYCCKHYQQLQRPENNDCINGPVSSCTINGTSSNPSAAGSSKRNANDDSTAAGPSVGSTMRLPSKRRLSFTDKQEESPSKCNFGGWTKIIYDSSNSDENVPNAEMQLFAPLESDLEESANSVPEQQFIGKDTETPTASTSGNQQEDESSGKNTDEDETIEHSGADSESLLLRSEICTKAQSVSKTSSPVSPQTVSTTYTKVILVEMEKREDEGSSPEKNPVHSPDQHTAGPYVPRQSSTRTPPSPDHSKPHSVTGSLPCTSLAISPAPHETICVSLISSSPSPVAPTFDPEPTIDSPSFWKSCNAAGCTQAIFTDFITEMNDISSRIQSDQASQGDYDLALIVMETSGKLAELVAKQQKELQRKQTELTKAAAAMKEVVSAVRRVHPQLL